MKACVALIVSLSVAAVLAQSARSGPTQSGRPGASDATEATSKKPPKDDSSARISGRIVHAITNQPLAGALIGAGTRTTVSGADGMFELPHLLAGLYTLTVSKSGFVTMQYGSRRIGEPARRITVGVGDDVTGIDVALPSGGVISGRVLDQYGQPLVAAPVGLLRQRYIDGERRLVSMAGRDANTGAAHTTDVTDDLGQFRLFGLLPGTYYLAAGQTLRAEETNRTFSQFSTQSAQVLYPGTTSLAEAQPVAVSEGAEVAGLTFIVTPSTAAAITGQMTSERTPVKPQVRIVQHGGITGDMTHQVTPGANGAFAVGNLAPGRYTLFAFAEGQIGRVTVNLGGEELFVPIALGSGSALSGRIAFEGAMTGTSDQKVPDPKDVRVTYSSRDFSGPEFLVRVDRDWTFRGTGLIGAVHLAVGAPGWFVKSIRRNGVDVTDSPLDADHDVNGVVVLLTRQVTTLLGRVRDDRNRATSEATVVVFAEASSRWGPRSRYVHVSRTDQDGRFAIAGLPPTRYLAVAVDYLPEGEESNPEFLQALARLGQRVELGAGERKTLELRRQMEP